MNSRRSNQRRPVRRSSNSTEFDGRPDRASRNGAYTRRDSFDPSAYGRSSDSSRTPSPRSTHDDNPYTRRVSQAEYTQRRKRAKRKRIALVAVAVVLVLCLGGAGAAFAYYQTVSRRPTPTRAVPSICCSWEPTARPTARRPQSTRATSSARTA